LDIPIQGDTLITPGMEQICSIHAKIGHLSTFIVIRLIFSREKKFSRLKVFLTSSSIFIY